MAASWDRCVSSTAARGRSLAEDVGTLRELGRLIETELVTINLATNDVYRSPELQIVAKMVSESFNPQRHGPLEDLIAGAQKRLG
jgi:hypothetical protein